MSCTLVEFVEPLNFLQQCTTQGLATISITKPTTYISKVVPVMLVSKVVPVPLSTVVPVVLVSKVILADK